MRCCDREGEVLSPAVKRRWREADLTPLHLVPSLRLSRAKPLLPLFPNFATCIDGKHITIKKSTIPTIVLLF